MQQKQRIREDVKQTGGSAHNATECVSTVQKGEEQVGSRGSCATREMIYNRSSSGVNGSKKGVLSDISTIYHYEYEFTETDVLWEYGFSFTRESGVSSCTRTGIVILCCCRMRGWMRPR
jgi:hypothetical protein